jgi:hypothetical protein
MWCAELHRLRAVFLKAIGAEANQIEVSFCEAIRIARDQKSSSLATRSEDTFAEYRRQKPIALGGQGSDDLFVDEKVAWVQRHSTTPEKENR